MSVSRSVLVMSDANEVTELDATDVWLGCLRLAMVGLVWLGGGGASSRVEMELDRGTSTEDSLGGNWIWTGAASVAAGTVIVGADAVTVGTSGTCDVSMRFGTSGADDGELDSFFLNRESKSLTLFSSTTISELPTLTSTRFWSSGFRSAFGWRSSLAMSTETPPTRVTAIVGGLI